MAYDIYGQNLAKGHCEVHPWVGESYPCSLCFAESKPKYDQRQKEYEHAEAEHYAQMERAHYEELARKSSFTYRVLCYMAALIDKLSRAVQKRKEKILIKATQNL